MANNPFEFINDLFNGDTPPALGDLNYRLSSFSIDFLPPLNVNAQVGVTALPDINANLNVGSLPDIKTQSGIGIIVDKLAPVEINAQLGVAKLPDINTNLNTDIRVGKLPKVELAVAIKELPKIVLNAGLDNLRVKELAPINLQFSLKPVKVRLPFGYSFKVGVLGLNLFSFSLQGELKAELDDL